MLPTNEPRLRDEIAAVAARLIAEDGLDYAGAKRRAMREVLGDARHGGVDCMPDNDEVEAAVRAHQVLFLSDSQPARLAALRIVARDVMRFLVEAGHGLVPYASGAIVNGTAGEHSDIHLQLFDDNAKDLEIHLLNAGIDFDVAESAGGRGGEVLSFFWPPTARRRDAQEVVHLSVLDPRDRSAGRQGERADLRTLEALIASHDDDGAGPR